MIVSNTTNLSPVIADAGKSAIEGIRTEENRFERNIAEVAHAQSTNSQNTRQRDEALVEQNEIVNAVQANVRSLESANQRTGTLIDIKV